jgi:hypothetical protein
VAVQAGPGTGKTHTVLCRAAWLLAERGVSAEHLLIVAPDFRRKGELRNRLAQHLLEAGFSGAAIRDAWQRVQEPDQLARQYFGCEPAVVGQRREELSALPADARANLAALASALGSEQLAERLVGQAIARLTSRQGPDYAYGELNGAGAMARLGVAVVEQAVRDAEARLFRWLRRVRESDGRIGALEEQMARTGDLRAVAPQLLSAVAPHAERETLRRLIRIVTLDMRDVARREELAAPARALVYEAAAAAVAAGSAGGAARGIGFGSHGPGRQPGGRFHVVVDDAHELSRAQAMLLLALARRGSLLACGDHRGATGSAGAAGLEELLRAAKRSVTYLEAPRFGGLVCGSVNSLGKRLWPSGGDSCFAPLKCRGGSERPGAPLSVALVRRWTTTDEAGNQHPEPLAGARSREAEVVADLALRLARQRPAASVAVLALTSQGLSVIERALVSRGVAPGRVETRTIDAAAGREWDAVIVAQLDDHFGRGEPELLDAASGLPLISPSGPGGVRVEPASTEILLNRCAAGFEEAGRRRFFRAVTRARERLALTGLTREVAAGGHAFASPVEWLRRVLGIARLSLADAAPRLDEAPVDVTVHD